MRKLWSFLPLLLCSAILAPGQVLVGRQVLAGSGVDQPRRHCHRQSRIRLRGRQHHRFGFSGHKRPGDATAPRRSRSE